MRKDTCRLDVITLDVKEKISAFIWSKEGLPFDCVRALPVPKPIGGTLVFAVNSLFYVNQVQIRLNICNFGKKFASIRMIRFLELCVTVSMK